jgi:glycosyltransferase involved in cell wall biosynthesis
MKLSIITVNKNNADGLEKTIQSVICQKFTDYEYIIIDGNSTDNSVNVIKKYSDSIHYWISEPDTGIYNAMNKGIKIATGEYVILMNSGDRFVDKNTLFHVFSKEHTADLLVGNIIMEWKRFNERRSCPSKITFYHFFAGDTLHHQATFTKRALFDEIGLYDEELEICSDWKFALFAIAKYNKSLEKLNEDIALRDVNGISNSEKFTSLLKKEHEETLQKDFPYFYDDYKELYLLKRFTFHRLKKHIKWRLRKIIRG